MVQIAVCETINAKTKISWEKVGVVPHIKITSKEAFSKAIELARVTSKKHRAQMNEKYNNPLNIMEEALRDHSNNTAQKFIIQSISDCYNSGLLAEGEINDMGYRHLLQYRRPEMAQIISKTNTLLHPNSANVYDSYTEALAHNGLFNLAVLNYEKAVEIAKRNKDSNLEFFIENLEKVKLQLHKKTSNKKNQTLW